MDSFINIFVIALVIGLLFSNVAKIILIMKTKKKHREYLTIVEDGMSDLTKDIEKRSAHMQETLAVINHELADSLKTEAEKAGAAEAQSAHENSQG